MGEVVSRCGVESRQGRRPGEYESRSQVCARLSRCCF
jgi:hypothetical protein